MSQVDESRIREIVRRVVGQSLGIGVAELKVEMVAAKVQAGKTVAIGADHGGYEMKEALKQELVELGYTVSDVGTHSKEAVDYPDFALAVALQVSGGKAWRGVVIDGAGIGSCMAANKVPGVRAAMAYDHASAINSREHNDANLLTLGAGLTGLILAKQVLKIWLATEFGGGRHAKRVDKIIQIEKQFLK
ncbi:MAG TPA: ribose 5-phosphate isomerase B [Levilinea sp.]|nr:ribose 5-phosphate isomerase B [Levilinea sp.]